MSDSTLPPHDHGETFVGRWSRLKRGEESSAAPQPGTADEAAERPIQTAPEEVLLTDADMPPVEELGEDSDFSGFLSQGVSDALREKALKKLWGLPMCGALDGLNDYDDDFSVLESLGDTLTYQMKQWAGREAQQALAPTDARGGAQQAQAPECCPQMTEAAEAQAEDAADEAGSRPRA